MKQLTLRLSDEQHEKLRYLAYTERKSQHAIILEWVERGLADVEMPTNYIKEQER